MRATIGNLISRLQLLWYARDIRAKLLWGFISIGLALLVVTGSLVYFSARHTLKAQSFDKLDAVRATHADELLTWLDERRLDVVAFAQDRDTITATELFVAAFTADDALGETTAERLESLRELYLNTATLIDAGDRSDYSAVHAEYHPQIRQYLNLHAYHDVFIVTPEGDVIYTTRKEDDFGINLNQEPYSETNLAQAFNDLMGAETAPGTLFTDFERYAPSGDIPAAFISTRILKDEDVIGVLVFQLSIDRLNALLGHNTGLGESGESFVVGLYDHMYRNRLRFADQIDIDSVVMNTSFKDDTDVPRIALRESDGHATVKDYRGASALASWQVIQMQAQVSGSETRGVTWVLVAQMKASEALQASGNLLGLFILIGVGAALGLVGFTYILADQIAQPIRRLTRAAGQIAAGDFAQQVEVEAHDEIGTLTTAFNQMATQLHETVDALEQRVAERTRSLRGAVQVSQATTLVLSPEELLPRVVDMIKRIFGLYYVGLFLAQEDGQYAVLHAGTGEAGARMVSEGHQHLIGGESFIGQCLARSEAIIAQNIGEATDHFRNPLLPSTRAEMALPMRSHGRIIGALTIQSEEIDAFEESDIAIMQTMADQIAVAIDNTRLFAASQDALAEAEAARQHRLREAWMEMQASGVTFHEFRVPGAPERQQLTPAEVQRALEQRGTVVINRRTQRATDHAALVAPVVLSDEVIGVLGIYDQNPMREWSADEISLFEDVVYRMALVAESRRLLEQTRARAGREQILRGISDQLQEARDMEQLMRVAAEALNNALRGSRAYVRLGLPDSDGAGQSSDGEDGDGNRPTTAE
jgi:GAF domain-containing protein/HAMP domain-containing protein